VNEKALAHWGLSRQKTNKQTEQQHESHMKALQYKLAKITTKSH
jgi:hypothetical protein